MIVLGIDLGKCLGYGAAGGKELHAGSFDLFEKWWPLGPSMLILEARLQRLIDEFRPAVIGVARPFVRYGRKGQGILDTPQNLIPQFGAFVILHRTAEKNHIPVDVMPEGEARSLLLGEFYPQESEAAKQAVWQACLDLGRRCPTKDASDALCIALGVLERRCPAAAHEATPLFLAAPPPPAKKRRRARAA